MTSVDELLSRYKPPTATGRILLDGEMYAELGRLATRLRDAARTETRGGVDVSDPSSPLAKLRVEYEELAARAEAAKTAFVFKALPRHVVEDIRRRHPPSEERWERYRQEVAVNRFAAVVPQWDTAAAAPELISKSLTAVDGGDVGWSVEDAAKLWQSLSEGQATELFDVMWSVQADTTSAPLSATVTGETNGSEPPSTTPPVTESPSQSS